MPPFPRESELTLLRPLADRYPNVDAAMAEIARLAAVLTLPKGTVHVISDIHGEDKKLRHVINNASGTLRPLAEELFASRMAPAQFQEFLSLIFYPNEMVQRVGQRPRGPEELRQYALNTLRQLFELVRILTGRYSLKWSAEVFPAEYRELLSEMLHEPTTERGSEFVSAIVEELVRRGRIWELIYVTVRLVRNLAINSMHNGIIFNNPLRYLPEGCRGSADVRDIRFSDVAIDCRDTPILMDVDAGIALPYLGRVSFAGFRIKSGGPIRIQGSPETPIQDVSFSDIRVETQGDEGIVCRYCRGVKFMNVELSNRPG